MCYIFLSGLVIFYATLGILVFSITGTIAITIKEDETVRKAYFIFDLSDTV